MCWRIVMQTSYETSHIFGLFAWRLCRQPSHPFLCRHAIQSGDDNETYNNQRAITEQACTTPLCLSWSLMQKRRWVIYGQPSFLHACELWSVTKKMRQDLHKHVPFCDAGVIWQVKVFYFHVCAFDFISKNLIWFKIANENKVFILDLY